MDWAKQRLASSAAAWKVVANELMMMNAELPGGSYYSFDNWQGYVTEREELLGHIKAAGIKDVVFITGDIHTFIAGDVRTAKSRGESVALEFVGGSITSQSLGETDLPLGGGQVLKGNDANPNTPPAIIDALRGVNPWVDQADFDHHGYGLVEATDKTFDVTLKRMQTIKKQSTRHSRPRASATRSPAARRRSRASTARPARMNRRPPPGAARLSSASPEEAAAVLAAIEQFLRDTAPPPAAVDPPRLNPYLARGPARGGRPRAGASPRRRMREAGRRGGPIVPAGRLPIGLGAYAPVAVPAKAPEGENGVVGSQREAGAGLTPI